MPFITTKDGAELYWREWGAGTRSPLAPIKLSAVFRGDEGHGICPICKRGEVERRLRDGEGMVDQDASVVVDDEELEPAREHGLAVGEQHLPAERHNVTA